MDEQGETDALGYAFCMLVAASFAATGFAIWIVLNAGALLFGIYVEPVWRQNVRFRVLFLPGRIPVVAIALPVMLSFGLWRTWNADGLLVAIAPFAVTILLGFGLLGALVALNRLRRKLPPWHLK